MAGGNIQETIDQMFSKSIEEDINVPFIVPKKGDVTSKVYNENCLLTMGRMEANFIDFILTSPPYGNLRKYHGYSFQFLPIAEEMYRVLKDGGVLVWVVGDQTIDGDEQGIPFLQVLNFKKIGFTLHDTMIYQKLNHPPYNHDRYEQAFEFMFVLSKGRPTTFNPLKVKCLENNMRKSPLATFYSNDSDLPVRLMTGKKRADKIKDNVWAYLTGNHGYTGSKGHPAPFPEQLAEDHILSWTNEGDVVYDPLMGSGTTGVICKALRRNFFGSEISEKYCKLALERLNTRL